MLRDLTINEMEIVSGGHFNEDPSGMSDTGSQGINDEMYSQINDMVGGLLGGAVDQGEVVSTGTRSLPRFDQNMGVFLDAKGHTHASQEECRSHYLSSSVRGGFSTGAFIGGVGGSVIPFLGNGAGLVGGAAWGTIAGLFVGVARGNDNCG